MVPPAGGARGNAAGDELGVTRDFAQVVEDAEIRARGGRAADAIHQAVFVGAGVRGGQVLEAHALELDVAGQHPVARQRQVARALEQLDRALEERVDLAPPARRKGRALGPIRWQARMGPSMASAMPSPCAGTSRSGAASSEPATSRS